MSQRQIPSNVDAEQAALGSMLLDDSIALDALQIAPPESFYLEKNQQIATVIKERAINGKPVDYLTVVSELATKHSGYAWGSYLTYLLTVVPTAANYKEYADLVRRAYQRRRMIQASTEIAEFAFDMERDEDALQSDAMRVLMENTAKGETGFSSAYDIAAENWDWIEERIRAPREVWGLKTGFPQLDRLIGGWQKQGFYLVAGNASVGKTFFLLTSILSLAYQGIPCAVVSLEMSQRQLYLRMIAIMSQTPSDHIQRGAVGKDEQWVALTDAQRDAVRDAEMRFAKLPIYFSKGAVRSAVDVRVGFTKLQQLYGIEFGGVDYAQLMGGSNPKANGNRNQELAFESRILKLTANDLNMAILALSQLSRDNAKRENKRPMLSDLRDTGALEQDADMVITLFSNEYWERQQGKVTEQTLSETELIEANIPKDRLSRAAGHTLFFERNRATGYYSEVDMGR